MSSEAPVEVKGEEFTPELLKLYYDRLFPYDAMFNWLAYGNDPSKENILDRNIFPNREWSFTIADDIYIRYQSFQNKQEMIAAIKKRQPHKIDIGAVFTGHPKDHATIKPELFKPVERELVFDIDMTDYDDVRICCTGAKICPRCWGYMTMAVKTVDIALRDDFGFKNIMWVYSGRRGVHCWVCDPSARALTNEARTAVVEYLSVHTGSKENSDRKMKQTFTHPIHPMVKRAYTLLEPYFEKFIANKDEKIGQGLLDNHNSFTKVLNTLPVESIRTELYEQWNKNSKESGAQRWRALRDATSSTVNDTAASKGNNKRKNVNYAELDAWRYELVLTHCYARLDINVSKTQNHLLKSPFCVHPKTGKVCVPIDPHTVDDFDPFSTTCVPTLNSLQRELDSWSGSSASEEGEDDIKKTSMKRVLETFDRAFMNKMNVTIRKEYSDANRDALDKKSAVEMDF